MRQVAVRDALVPPGFYNGKGGPLGEPDFELIATVGAFAIGSLILVHLLAKSQYLTLQMRIGYAIGGATIGGLFFSS